jgi:hypothetical protein
MIHKRRLYFFILFTVLITGCAVYHSPVTIPSLIKKQGDIQANAGLIWLSPGAYANVGCGITNFISAQVSGSYTLPGTFHFDGSAGFYKNINKINFGIYGGYVYGKGEYDDDGLMGMKYHWNGNYQIPYGKIQFIFAPKKKFCFGTIVKVGNFNMSFNKYAEYYNRNEANALSFGDYKFINRKSLLVEPSLFCIILFSEKVGLTFNYTNSWFNKIDDHDIYNSVGENRFGLGNLGIGVVLMFDTEE